VLLCGHRVVVLSLTVTVVVTIAVFG